MQTMLNVSLLQAIPQHGSLPAASTGKSFSGTSMAKARSKSFKLAKAAKARKGVFTRLAREEGYLLPGDLRKLSEYGILIQANGSPSSLDIPITSGLFCCPTMDARC